MSFLSMARKSERPGFFRLAVEELTLGVLKSGIRSDPIRSGNSTPGWRLYESLPIVVDRLVDRLWIRACNPSTIFRTPDLFTRTIRLCDNPRTGNLLLWSFFSGVMRAALLLADHDMVGYSGSVRCKGNRE